MRGNLLTAAKSCLAVGCASALALLVVPLPSSSPQYLAAHDARSIRLSPGVVVAKADEEPPRPQPTADATPVPLNVVRLSETDVRHEVSDHLVAPPVGRVAAAETALAPLAGLDPLPSSSPTLPAEPQPADGGLVPDPTPDPAPRGDGRLADEIRALRGEVLRLAQAQPEPAAASTADVAGEMRQLLDEMRDTERFRRLEEQLRLLQGAQGAAPGPVVGDEGPGRVLRPALTSVMEVPGKDGPLIRAVPSGAGDDRFTLQVEGADVTHVLDLLGQMAGWNVVAAPGVTGAVVLNLRDVTLDEALAAILTPRDLVAERKENLLFVFPRLQADARAAAARVVVTKVYRPHYISVKDLDALVTPLLTPTIGKKSVTSPSTVGLELDATDGGGDDLSQGDALVVQDYPEVIEQVDEIVLEMDVPPLQVVIEAYVLRVRLDDEMRFGVNFALLNNSNRQLVTSGSGAVLATSTGFPSERESLIPPLPQFLLPAAGLRYGFLTGDVTGFIEALEGISETSLVASPSLRVLNKQKAELIIGQRLGYKTQTFNNQQTIENVQFLDVGTKLVLRPFAAPDGLVRMEIHPERSSGVIDENGLPQVDTTEVTTNVMVRDGATVVVGGLIDEQTEEDVNQVPILGSIPLLGYAFRNSDEALVRNEMIVLITPRIVCDPVEEARGEVLRSETERRAAHFADKLSPVSRRNLARMHTERAADLYEQGRLVQAHDHARHALSIRRNDGEAMRLKDRIEQSLRSRTKRFLFWPGAETAPPDGAPLLAPPSDAPPGRAVVPNDPLHVPPAPLPEPVLEPTAGLSAEPDG